MRSDRVNLFGHISECRRNVPARRHSIHGAEKSADWIQQEQSRRRQRCRISGRLPIQVMIVDGAG
jgi:hypothetical protein